MIAIIGATGTIGNALVERLIKLDVPARALSRKPEKLEAKIKELGGSKVEAVMADASDPSSLYGAFNGADQLFLAMGNSPNQVEIETSIIHTAAQAGIKHIVKISSPAFEERSPVAVAGWHWKIEQVLAESGLTYTVLRPYAFMQNLLRLIPTVTAQSMFFGSMGSSPCNFIDCRDIADVAAEVLTDREKAGQIYTLTGSETFSYPQIADKLSMLLDRNIQYINLEPEVQRSNLIEHAQMPPWLADHVVEIQTMATVVPERPTDTVKRLLGRDPRTLDAFLQEHIELFR
ncbi:SDR family oxidoreductase [Paenibacillus azoreducens]|uniref:NAD(P)-dependent oxidoreductase n=1 Tax=Paenibacillus azoreducens TaxID=116718 RepID=A0A919YIA0_9BACL|nr:SDR family oxidoreductase [Paenibacillus azoreducens]GIO49170.1 NAD(P)-dependent oxidoreductase [Paenibacillus azoreducens]